MSIEPTDGGCLQLFVFEDGWRVSRTWYRDHFSCYTFGAQYLGEQPCLLERYDVVGISVHKQKRWIVS